VSVLLCCRPLWRLTAVLGLALMGLVFAPGASAAPLLDTVNVTGSTSDGFVTNINISAHGGTSGQNPSGTASATENLTNPPMQVSGPVTCLSVTGPDRGAGTSAAPTTATLNVQTFTFAGVIKVMVVDKGGNGGDEFLFDATFSGPPTDCSPISPQAPLATLFPGRAVVFDAPVLPTSKDQCKDGGWKNFPQFKNQGDCVSFVEKGK
jgi:hypothetical protein